MRSPPVNLAEVLTLPPPTLEQILHMVGVPTTLHSNVSCRPFQFHILSYLQCIMHIPHILVTLLCVNVNLNIKFGKAVLAIPDLEVQILSASPEKVEILLTRRNPTLSPDFRAYAPKFPKPQTEGWFVILGDVKHDAIYALKRVSWPLRNEKNKRNRPCELRATANASLMLPPGFTPGVSLTVIVISDCYRLDFRQEFQIDRAQIVEAVRGH